MPRPPSPTATLVNKPAAQDVESMKLMIKHLQEQLARASHQHLATPVCTENPDIEIATSSIGGTFHIQGGMHLLGACDHFSSRSVMHKTRLFGQSHWCHEAALLRDILAMIEPFVREDTSKVASTLKKCKSLAKVIKSQREPPWPSPPTSSLPPKDVADELVDCYLRTTEAIYRILHVPTFRKDYEALWTSGVEPDAGFLVQVKLVLAIGATVYDEDFSLRPSAVKWVFEAQTWLSEPEFKSRLSIQSLQNNILLLLARETAAVGGALIWISVGSLFRAAVHMGLHRDPAFLPKRSMAVAEMRRRLWNTILEITLHTSMASGGPPLLSLSDFDTQSPGNFDDDELTVEGAQPKPEGVFTQTSIAIALRAMFPLRLAIARFLNGLGSRDTYEETLRLDAELRALYQTLCRTLQGYGSNGGRRPSQFEVSVVDILTSRYRLSLHTPFFAPALHEAVYAYSRKVAVETALKIWSTVNLSSSSMAAQSLGDPHSSDQVDLTRLSICGAGIFRLSAFQASLIIAVELRTRLQEESLGPVLVRQDLLSVVEEAKAWAWRSIEIGETNIKGYLMLCLAAAQIEGTMRDLGRDELIASVVKAGDETVARCLSILEAKAAQGLDGGDNQVSLSTPPDLVEDWDFTISDAQFGLGMPESTNWLFNNEPIPDRPWW